MNRFLLLAAPGCALSSPSGAKGRLERAAAALEVAVTVDDLPLSGSATAGSTPARVLRQMIEAFARHRLPPVTGFVNGRLLEQHPDSRAALEAWRAAGHLLGNHTYSHARLASVGLQRFLADIDRNDPLLRELAGAGAPEQSWKLFRSPYLEEGTDPKSREAIRAHLEARE